MTDIRLAQTPAPGRSTVKFRGDAITFSLELSRFLSGKAWLRTTIGNIRTTRREAIQAVVREEPILGRAWYDIPMTRVSPLRFEITIALTETGHFEGKCLFFKTGAATPLWPPGDNAVINVQPADLCCANIIYNAFVRQFGPNKAGGVETSPQQTESIRKLDHDGYTVIPPSGTFRDLIGELDFIIGELGCRILHLLPINPTPTTYGRMGRFGSPYAALDFTGIDPALAVFDPKATPLEQFMELADAVHRRNAKLIIDLAPNHTGWAAELHETHPEWLVRDEEGKIEAPGAWGVVWEDLTRLDYTNRELWKYMADVFLTWCGRGVDGFRCDAGYMIPVAAWNFIVAKVREQYPDTIFFLEGLGGKISVTRRILNESNFNWAYSELFQNYHRDQIQAYLPLADTIAEEDGIMVHFAETHDNNRLAATSTVYAAMRTALCALVSHCGGFGFANGVEWFATEKIMVHDACSLNWGAPVNQVARILRLSRLLKRHPAFWNGAHLRQIQQGGGDYLAVVRHHPESGKRVMALVNLDTSSGVDARWREEDAGIHTQTWVDLITGETAVISKENGFYIHALPPGGVACLSPDLTDAALLDAPEEAGNPTALPARIYRQCLQALVLKVYRYFTGSIIVEGLDMDAACRDLARDPVRFCRSMNAKRQSPDERPPDACESRVTPWQYPEDSRREVMVPPGHFLLIRAPHPFTARLTANREEATHVIGAQTGLGLADGGHFALFMPSPAPNVHTPRLLKLTVHEPGKSRHLECPLLYLSVGEKAVAKTLFTRRELLGNTLGFLGTNGRGAMMRAKAQWGYIESKYDALLAANLNPDCPDTRWMMLIRCRAWLVFQGYSQDVSINCLTRFWCDPPDRACWEFVAPSGQGQHVVLMASAEMAREENRIQITFTRKKSAGEHPLLPNHKPVQLIIRPDIDDRSFHHLTKAYTGPETHWPGAVAPFPAGFSFSPQPERRLTVAAGSGHFIPEPEWQYMQYLPVDAERGMEPHTDLFSPGYFSAFLRGGESLALSAAVSMGAPPSPPPATRGQAPFPAPRDPAGDALPLHEAMAHALGHFIVKRQAHQTVIAGYPWFLDWGRDTLIVARGLIAAGRISEARDILIQFARFEEKGTLPNIILGENTGNRDTSDAPLWLLTACRDFIHATGDLGFLRQSCGGRTLREVLLSIVTAYIKGTPNGIYADPETGLVFSPSHYTWMDTNFPAGTPREGYPVEIQALWRHALAFMEEIDPNARPISWGEKAKQVRASIETLFYLRDQGYLSDCLHAGRGVSATHAEPDDALRPNQLLAVTLGALSDPRIRRGVVESCECLILPGGIRSLADRRVKRPLPVTLNGRLLNDPHHPYQGHYAGDEDTQRKPAYHNGTAWTWMFPAFCEAWACVYGPEAKPTAQAFLASSTLLANKGSVGQLPEIMDGDAPHLQKGCDAQAWGVSEWLRVWKLLNDKG